MTQTADANFTNPYKRFQHFSITRIDSSGPLYLLVQIVK